jgi:hypothetical protein
VAEPHLLLSTFSEILLPLLLSTYLSELDNPRGPAVDSSWTGIGPKANLSEIISNNISNKLFIKKFKIHFTNRKKYYN